MPTLYRSRNTDHHFESSRDFPEAESVGEDIWDSEGRSNNGVEKTT